MLVVEERTRLIVIAAHTVFMGFVREQGLFDFGEDGSAATPVSTEHMHELQTIIDLNIEGARLSERRVVLGVA